MERIIVTVLLGTLLSLQMFGVLKKTATYDEPAHLRYGQQFLEGDSSRFDDSKMPFSVFNALTLKFAGPYLSGKGPGRNYLPARIATMLFTIILGLLVYFWSRSLYGPRGAILSLFLYTFSPNIIAHGRLVTTDLYAALMITAALYTFWRFVNKGGWALCLISAITLGVAQLSKYTCIYLYPVFAAMIIIRSAGPFLTELKNKRYLAVGRQIFRGSGYAFFFVVISLLCINAGFLFNRSLVPFGEYSFRSQLFRELQSIALLNNVPTPVPYPYIEGLDWVKANEQDGSSYGNIYLMGELRKSEGNFSGFGGYFFMVSLFKMPLPVQIYFLGTLLLLCVHRHQLKFLHNEWFLFCPLLFFVLYFNYFYRAQIGIRHFVVVFPLIHILCGYLGKQLQRLGLIAKATVISLALYLIVSVVTFHPHFLSYGNELVGDRKTMYRLFADSNIDWGQNEIYLENFFLKHPDAVISPAVPVDGLVVVGLNDLVGITRPQRYAWLRENFEPIDHVAYSYLVYHLGEGALSSHKISSDKAYRRRRTLQYPYGIATNLQANKAYDRSLEFLGLIERRNPDYKKTLFLKGFARQMLGDNEGAVQSYRRFLLKTDEYHQAHFNLAYAYMTTGRYTEAIDHFERTLQLKPDYHEAQHHIDFCRQKISTEN